MSYKSYIHKDLSKEDEGPIDRCHIEYHENFNKKDEFTLSAKSRTYEKQFFSMYQYRLATLKTRVDDNALKKWGNGTKKVDGQVIVKKDKILDITSGQLCWVSGTVFSDSKHKLNIMHDVDKGIDDIIPKPPSLYVYENESVTVMLEDESGRAILHNDEFLQKNLLVTGCIVAVLGIEIQAGIFEIMDVIYPTWAPQKPLPDSNKGKIAFVSGLNIQDSTEHDLKLELLKQYLLGELGLEEDKKKCSDIVRLLVAGDSIAPIEEDDKEDDFVSTNNYGSKNLTKFNPESIVKLDEFLSDLCSSIPISLMPGPNDPAEICIPQQPIHKSLFPENRRYVGGESFENLTNPAWIDLNGIRMLGTSGQNVEDILKYISPDSQLHDPCKVLECNIKWQNIVPTAPDTLYCYPFDDKDPFVLHEELPHIYFVGNQEKFDSWSMMQDNSKITLISVPKFYELGKIVILDLSTMACETITIAI